MVLKRLGLQLWQAAFGYQYGLRNLRTCLVSFSKPSLESETSVRKEFGEPAPLLCVRGDGGHAASLVTLLGSETPRGSGT